MGGGKCCTSGGIGGLNWGCGAGNGSGGPRGVPSGSPFRPQCSPLWSHWRPLWGPLLGPVELPLWVPLVVLWGPLLSPLGYFLGSFKVLFGSHWGLPPQNRSLFSLLSTLTATLELHTPPPSLIAFCSAVTCLPCPLSTSHPSSTLHQGLGCHHSYLHTSSINLFLSLCPHFHFLWNALFN